MGEQEQMEKEREEEGEAEEEGEEEEEGEDEEEEDEEDTEDEVQERDHRVDKSLVASASESYLDLDYDKKKLVPTQGHGQVPAVEGYAALVEALLVAKSDVAAVDVSKTSGYLYISAHVQRFFF